MTPDANMTGEEADVAATALSLFSTLPPVTEWTIKIDSKVTSTGVWPLKFHFKMDDKAIAGERALLAASISFIAYGRSEREALEFPGEKPFSVKSSQLCSCPAGPLFQISYQHIGLQRVEHSGSNQPQAT